MPQSYHVLALHRLKSGTGYFRSKRQPLEKMTPDQPAVTVMADPSWISAHVTPLSTPLSTARNTMISHGISMLLVCDAHNDIVGLLTSSDLEGNKPDRILAKAGIVWDDLQVADVMALRPKLETLLMNEVLKARIGDIIATLQQVHRQQVLVVDNDPDTGNPVVCGMLSLSQIGRRLALELDPACPPMTNAELERIGEDGNPS